MRPLLTIPVFLMTAVCFGLVVAWASTRVLKFGYPFSNRFPYTCIDMPGKELDPMLVAFVFVLGAAIACFVAMFRRIARPRRHTFGLMIEIGLGLAVYISQTVDGPTSF